MNWIDDKQKIVKDVYNYFLKNNEKLIKDSDDEDFLDILKVTTKEDVKFILERLLEEFGENSKYKVFKEPYERVGDRFWVSRGNGFNQFNYDQWIKEEESLVKSAEQDQRIKDLTEQNLEYDRRIKELESKLRWIKHTKNLLWIVVTVAGIGFIKDILDVVFSNF